jgi:hypothetical protein
MPAHREMYEAHFHCPVTFKAKQNALVFSKADMELPFVTHNADLLATIAPQLEAELKNKKLAPDKTTASGRSLTQHHPIAALSGRKFTSESSSEFCNKFRNNRA